MLKIGCHLSSSKGYLAMGREALRIGANTFQFFTRNPRGGAAKRIDENDVAAYRKFAQENKLGRILAHAPYVLNPCSADEGLRDFAKFTMADDLARLEHTPGSFYNFHPGSHVKQGVDVGIEYIIKMLNEVIKPEQTTTVLLETMSGKGSEIGSSFDELKRIIEGVSIDGHMGVCLDTCHVFSAGYDIVSGLDRVLEDFDSIIGIERLRAIHLNDSMNPFASRKDRHAKIGEGSIGLDAFERIINHRELRELPFYLETPNDPDGYGREIRLLKSLYREG
ncbi:MAG: deoxyribonuclease IV [Christensenellales bacterium]|jgi:deoxyribonuclease-4